METPSIKQQRQELAGLMEQELDTLKERRVSEKLPQLAQRSRELRNAERRAEHRKRYTG